VWQHIAERISQETGRPFSPRAPRSQGGGCINTALLLEDGDQQWFVKLNDATRLSMFEAEAEGLRALADTRSIRVPEPLFAGVHDGQSYIVMEYVPMGGGSGRAMARAGERLAALHRHTAQAFGWHRDNTIGSTHQPNAWREQWIEFWREQRLGHQLALAARQGYGGRLQSLGERLLETFPALIDHDPVPSLIHGDLWSGNLAFDREDQPVIYDPATYYGDREAEIAMTELFGGFGSAFYEAYASAWPLDPGYQVRRTLYNLYHILNHANMFGGGYLGQAQRMMEQLLAELEG
jgi:fructosamine-3-kinase